MDEIINSDEDSLGNKFENLSEYEQRRIRNMKRNYEVLKSVGITPKIPQFLMPKDNLRKNVKKICIDKERGKSITNQVFKNVTFKLFGVGNNSKLTAENMPADSELKKFVHMAKWSVPRKTQHEEQKQTVMNLNDRQFVESFLKDAEIYLKKMESYCSQENKLNDFNEKDQKKEIVTARKCRYPKRNVQRKCYKEDDVSSEDEFLHCDACDCQYKGACPVHGPMLWVRDRKTSKNDPEKAVGTLPTFLSISESAIPKAGLGIWTEVPLPQGFVFGPYKGRVTRDTHEAQKSGYDWQEWKGQRPLHYVEGEDKSGSNWMRYVNCASREEQQNMVAFQYKKHVYYRTYKAILPFTELLVWYGNDYAGDMGIDTTEDKDIPPPSDIEGYECDVCEALFTSPSALERHRKKHPHMQSDRRHRCHLCSYSTDHAHCLRHHLLTHSGERPHRCTHCKKTFGRKSNLQRHLRIHTGEQPFSCSTCGRTFNQLSSLRTHERTHSGERLHRCSTCGKDFIFAGSLQRHNRVHTQQKPYRCPHCDYRSSYSSDLRQHIVSKHTRAFTHTCSLCGKGFIKPSEMKRHIDRQHSANEEKSK